METQKRGAQSRERSAARRQFRKALRTREVTKASRLDMERQPDMPSRSFRYSVCVLLAEIDWWRSHLELGNAKARSASADLSEGVYEDLSAAAKPATKTAARHSTSDHNLMGPGFPAFPGQHFTNRVHSHSLPA